MHSRGHPPPSCTGGGPGTGPRCPRCPRCYWEGAAAVAMAVVVLAVAVQERTPARTQALVGRRPAPPTGRWGLSEWSRRCCWRCCSLQRLGRRCRGWCQCWCCCGSVHGAPPASPRRPCRGTSASPCGRGAPRTGAAWGCRCGWRSARGPDRHRCPERTEDGGGKLTQQKKEGKRTGRKRARRTGRGGRRGSRKKESKTPCSGQCRGRGCAGCPGFLRMEAAAVAAA